ncbi:hypothetical protein BUALT_Bualt01G0056500 [Buddleja alternifolia]|uniref:DUF7356 domain-containing protein n=1 Tax=Buddleja alternifolia TaxID=168488 RepID=A0AAV6Y5R0_9LAMI|nr:hypothetical protein BUALT_Bualt01G0056500 [Buddleja alternifolia]
MKLLRLTLLVIFSIQFVQRQSTASFLQNFRKYQMSPSPSPVPAENTNPGNDQSPMNPPKGETCDMVSNECDIKDYSITACVPFLGDGFQAPYLLVQNGGESSLKLNIVLRPENISLEDIAVCGHEIKKVNLTSNVGSNSSILLSVGNKECTIQIAALTRQDFSMRYMTPVNGAYLFLLTTIFIGGTWACCKFKKTRRHLNGVPYQELEMRQQDSNPSYVIETAEGWDKNWDDDDDDWDEEKAVRSPGARKVLENGTSLKYIDTSQWRNDWDD